MFLAGNKLFAIAHKDALVAEGPTGKERTRYKWLDDQGFMITHEAALAKGSISLRDGLGQFCDRVSTHDRVKMLLYFI